MDSRKASENRNKALLIHDMKEQRYEDDVLAFESIDQPATKVIQGDTGKEEVIALKIKNTLIY